MCGDTVVKKPTDNGFKSFYIPLFYIPLDFFIQSFDIWKETKQNLFNIFQDFRQKLFLKKNLLFLI